jgi:DNA invertase Pin-like site-specific DNA recombinase
VDLTGIYCRISDDREGTKVGVERQEKLCRQLVEREGGTVVDVYVDDDISASAATRKRRPDYQRLLADVHAGHITKIVSYTLKRLTRRYREGADLLDLADATGVRFAFVRAPEVDLNSAAGRKHFRGMVNDAISESEEIGERVRDKFAEKIQAGEYMGGPRMFGFEPDGVTLRESEAAEVRKATRRLLGGESLRSIMQDWRSRGVPTARGGAWSVSTVRGILARPRNAGLVERDGAEYPAQWPGMVPEAEWRGVRALLGDPGRFTGGPRSPRWLGSRRFLCGVCDAVVVTSGGQQPGRSSYRCLGGAHVRRVAAPVDDWVLTVLVEIMGRPEVRLRMFDVPEADVAALQTEAAAIRADIAALRVALGAREIDLADFRAAKAGMTGQLEAVEARLTASASRSPLSGIADAEDVEGALRAAPIGRQRAVVDVLARVTLLPGARGRLPGGAYFDPESVRVEPL